MSDILSPTDLLEFLKFKDSSFYDLDNNTDKKLRYVIYARKSTQGEERQERSINDQIDECRKYAERNELLVVGDPIIEMQSAKEPGIRLKFTQMILDIKKGRYDGILSWHPDRLSRNMKEAGEIIDLLDKGIIRNLKFVTYDFTNDVSGKMTLGINFVISKHYSDALSNNVLRGINNSAAEGKYPNAAMHGYFKDRNQFLRPDGENFGLMRRAWDMKLSGETHKKICEYLNNCGYQKAKGKDGEQHKDIEFDLNALKSVFVNPVYAGVMRYGDTLVNLTEKYEFISMVTVEEYMKVNNIQSLDDLPSDKYRTHNARKGIIFSGMLICNKCGKQLVHSPTSKRIKGLPEKIRYHAYRCDTAACPFKGKSVRGHVVVDFVLNYLENHSFDSLRFYEIYKQQFASIVSENEKLLKSYLTSKKRERSVLKEKLIYIKEYIPQQNDPSLRTEFENDFKNKSIKLKETDGEIKELEEDLKINGSSIPNYEKILELWQDIPLILQNPYPDTLKDQVVRLLFSKFLSRE